MSESKTRKEKPQPLLIYLPGEREEEKGEGIAFTTSVSTFIDRSIAALGEREKNLPKEEHLFPSAVHLVGFILMSGLGMDVSEGFIETPLDSGPIPFPGGDKGPEPPAA